MKKGNLIPIVCIVILSIIVVYLIASKTVSRKVPSYNHFSFEYKNDVTEYDDINVSDIIIVNNTSFWVVALEGNKIVFNSNMEIDKENTEFTVNLNEPKMICFEEDDCVVFNLS